MKDAESIVSASSFLPMKSELVRKTLERKNIIKPAKLKVSRYLGTKVGSENSSRLPIDKDAYETEERKRKLEESWIQLNRKAKIYDKKADGYYSGSDDDELVNFLKKSNEEETKSDLKWAKVEDEFGRSRLVQVPIKKTEMTGFVKAGGELEDYSSNPHFDSTREKRTLGVGFYQFKKDEKGRNEQMRVLNDRRDETIKERSNAVVGKEKRKERLEERRELLEKRNRNRRQEGAILIAESFLDNL